jgi:hypothetical protein
LPSVPKQRFAVVQLQKAELPFKMKFLLLGFLQQWVLVRGEIVLCGLYCNAF